MRCTILIIFLLTLFSVQMTNAQGTDKPPYKYDEKNIKKTASGLQYVIIEEGKGAVAKPGEMITAHYHGLLPDGKVFDSSFDRGQPFSTAIGVGRVIRGWDEAFTTFKEGTKAVLIIPPGLAYGERAMGSIPANSTLHFHVHLIKVGQ